MDDLISREAAIELCDWYEHEFCECEYALREIADDLKKLPSAEPKMGVKRTERGWAGHFIASPSCLFRRNTLLEYADKQWVISTVGACYVDGKLEKIGHERYYETMAFEAKLRDGYIEADVERQIDFCSPWAIHASSKEELLRWYPLPDETANNMHEAVVAELMEKIRG